MVKNRNPASRHERQQALALLQENRLQEAHEAYLRICLAEPEDAGSWSMLGVIEGRLGRMSQAASSFQKAITLRPGFAEAHYNLGKARRALGQLEPAAASYEAALHFRPDWPDALYNLGNVFGLLGRLREAEKCYRHVLAIDPRYSRAHKVLGNVLIALGDLEEATACFETLAGVDPGSVEARIGQAKVLERRGEVDQASAMTEELIESGTRNLELDLLYASLHDPSDAIERLAPWANDEHQVAEKELQATLHFMLGDSYDRQQDFRRAFEHYQTANRLKARPYDVSAFASFVGEVISVFTPDLMSAAPRATHGSDRPLFILGMPRSGTTLVEQILSSHPEVFGAGELEDIRRISLEVLKTDEQGRIRADCLADLTAETCNRYAARYLDHLDELADGAPHVTDKMPHNFIGVGVIALLFPEARIIHCRRDPVDTCFSCFSNDFGATHDYATDLETLGRYYREYQRMMRHWRGTLGIPMLEVDYEALVADQEATTRALLDYCRLEWNEQCLRFHENRRSVSTSSYDQVRKPIYASSIGKWKDYEPYLGPLIESLGLH